MHINEVFIARYLKQNKNYQLYVSFKDVVPFQVFIYDSIYTLILLITKSCVQER